jgi:HAD superfamily hydrolase (TIGR01509 family)
MPQSGQKPARSAAASPTAGHRQPSGLVAVAFDMDGLLVDSEPLWFLAESAVMARLGAVWDPADQHALVGGSLGTTVDYLLAKATRPAEPPVVARWLTETMVDLVSSRPLTVLPGAADLVAEVQTAGLPYALVTSSVPAVVDAVLARLDIRFDVVVCAADVTHAKPDPEGYLLAAAKLGADPRQCIALEDSPNGVAAAEAAGYRVIAVPSVVPVPDAPGRVVLSTLADVTLAALRASTGLEPEPDRRSDMAGLGR